MQIYLDYSATTPTHPQVIERAHLERVDEALRQLRAVAAHAPIQPVGVVLHRRGGRQSGPGPAGRPPVRALAVGGANAA